jgi:hypothetical protein
VVACDEVRYDGLLPLLCLVEASACLLPARAEEAREHSVDHFFHFNADELGIEVRRSVVFDYRSDLAKRSPRSTFFVVF